jgi:hypothetical protein
MEGLNRRKRVLSREVRSGGERVPDYKRTLARADARAYIYSQFWLRSWHGIEVDRIRNSFDRPGK